MTQGRQPLEIRRRLPRSHEAPSEARGIVRDLLGRRSASREVVENTELVVSELVTNALRHGEGGIELRLRLGDATALVEVVDGGRGSVAAVHPRPPDEDGGWGLHIVERLAERWGVFEGTTHVWAELTLDPAA